MTWARFFNCCVCGLGGGSLLAEDLDLVGKNLKVWSIHLN